MGQKNIEALEQIKKQGAEYDDDDHVLKPKEQAGLVAGGLGLLAFVFVPLGIIAVKLCGVQVGISYIQVITGGATAYMTLLLVLIVVIKITFKEDGESMTHAS